MHTYCSNALKLLSPPRLSSPPRIIRQYPMQCVDCGSFVWQLRAGLPFSLNDELMLCQCNIPGSAFVLGLNQLCPQKGGEEGARKLE